MRKLILSSQSPRRSELLNRAGFTFTTLSVQISEIPDENMNLLDQIADLARRKAQACLNSGKLAKGEGNLILASDTVVVLDGQILGKPKDRTENRQMIERLSGRKHGVLTGVALLDLDTGREVSAVAESKIQFRDLQSSEIGAYVDTDDGLDKAGGYGIQNAAGKFVASFDGDMDTIVGLPIKLVEKLLLENGWHVDRG